MQLDLQVLNEPKVQSKSDQNCFALPAMGQHHVKYQNILFFTVETVDDVKFT